MREVNHLNLEGQKPYTPICEEYIVTSKDCGSGVFLIGWLRHNNGDYTFEYYEKPPYAIGVRGALSLGTRYYSKDAVSKHILEAFAPSPGSSMHEEFCKEFGVPSPCPNQWQLFEANWEHYAKMCLNQSEPLGDPIGVTLFWRQLNRRIRNG